MNTKKLLMDRENSKDPIGETERNQSFNALIKIKYDNPRIRGPGGAEFHEEIVRENNFELEDHNTSFGILYVSTGNTTRSNSHRHQKKNETQYQKVTLLNCSKRPENRNLTKTTNLGLRDSCPASVSPGAADFSALIDQTFDDSKQYSILQDRENSFKNHKWKSSSKKPRHLAKAGFYFRPNLKSSTLEVTTDSATCFACGLELHDWKYEDSAFTEHEKHIARHPKIKCYYLKEDDFNLYKMYHNVRKGLLSFGYSHSVINRSVKCVKSEVSGSRIRSETQLTNILLDKLTSEHAGS